MSFPQRQRGFIQFLAQIVGALIAAFVEVFVFGGGRLTASDESDD